MESTGESYKIMCRRKRLISSDWPVKGTAHDAFAKTASHFVYFSQTTALAVGAGLFNVAKMFTAGVRAQGQPSGASHWHGRHLHFGIRHFEVGLANRRTEYRTHSMNQCLRAAGGVECGCVCWASQEHCKAKNHTIQVKYSWRIV
jgi:hypothetical protein